MGVRAYVAEERLLLGPAPRQGMLPLPAPCNLGLMLAG
jgi:hypothetical protein